MRQATRQTATSRFSFPLRRDRARTKLVALVIIVLMLAAGFVATVEYISRPDRFPVLEARLEGEFVHVSQQQLLVAVAEHLRGNLFLLDIEAVRARVEALPWVRRAVVSRQWPHTVQIHFSEEHLVAHWDDRLWLNRYGEIVDLQGEAGPEELPLLRGPDGSHGQVLAQLQRLNDVVRAAGLDVAELTLSDQRAWRARLSNNLPVLLGRHDPEGRLVRLMEVYGDTVAGRVEQIRQVDLRYTNGFSVEWMRLTPVRDEG